jgi:hypothetical protein
MCGQTSRWSSHGVRAFRVVVETDFFNGALNREMEAILSTVAEAATMSGFIRQGTVVRQRAAVWVHDETQSWASRLLQFAGLIQLTVADDIGEPLAESFGAEPALSGHPDSGARPEPDEMLTAIAQLPEAPSGWRDEDIGGVVGMLRDMGALANGEGSSFVAEFPFGPNGRLAAGGGDANLLGVRTDDAHPVLGSGVRMTLRLRQWPTREDGVQILPLSLNEMERDQASEAHFLGSWAIAREADAVPY